MEEQVVDIQIGLYIKGVGWYQGMQGSDSFICAVLMWVEAIEGYSRKLNVPDRNAEGPEFASRQGKIWRWNLEIFVNSTPCLKKLCQCYFV